MNNSKLAILCIEPYDLHLLYKLNLKIYLGLDCIQFNNPQEVIDHLMENKNISIIILPDIYKGHEMADSVYDYIYKVNFKIPFIALGRFNKDSSIPNPIKDKKNLRKVIKLAAHLLDITPEKMVSEKVSEYYPIAWKLIELTGNSICDVFLKSLTDQGQYIYNLLLEKNHSLDQLQIDNLKRYGLIDLYIKAKDRFKFINFYNEQLLTQMEAETNTLAQRMVQTDLSYSVISEAIAEFGIDDDLLNLAQSCMKSIVKTSKQSDSLKHLLKNLLANETSYRYRHGQLINYLCLYATKNSTDDKSSDIFTYAAFFHDIFLEKDSHARVHSNKDLTLLATSDKDAENIQRHAINGFELAMSIKSCPRLAAQIILEHHGKKEGIGFAPQNLNFDEYTTVFMVCEVLANYLIELHEEGKMPERNTLAEYLRSYYKDNVEKVNKVINAFTKIEV